MKNSVGGLNNNFELTEEKISELENRCLDIMQLKNKGKLKELEKNMKHH